MRPPIANPRTERGIPRVATSRLTLKSSMVCMVPPVYADDTRVRASMAQVANMVRLHLVAAINSSGLRGLVGIYRII